MEIKEYLYNKFKLYFENEISKDKYILKEKEKENSFNTFIDSFINKYIENSEKDNYFRKKLIRKYANYLFLDNINTTMSKNSAATDINTFYIEDLFEYTKKKISLSHKTIFITHPYKGGNLTGNTNAYRGVIYNGFVFDKINIKGIYIEELDIGYIHNGNHSISIGSIVDDIKIETNDDFFKSCNLKKEFYDSKILYNKIVVDNKEIEIKNWKFAALLKMIQITYI